MSVTVSLFGYDPQQDYRDGDSDRVSALYLISNAWGPKFGGINAFNTDFTKHLGLALGCQIKVGCIVLEADEKDIDDAAKHQVDLIPIGPSPGRKAFDPARAYDILATLHARQLPTDSACWVGHDIVTGDVDNGMAGVSQTATVQVLRVHRNLAKARPKQFANQLPPPERVV